MEIKWAKNTEEKQREGRGREERGTKKKRLLLREEKWGKVIIQSQRVLVFTTFISEIRTYLAVCGTSVEWLWVNRE